MAKRYLCACEARDDEHYFQPGCTGWDRWKSGGPPPVDVILAPEYKPQYPSTPEEAFAAPDPVNHPSHYKRGGIEAIDVIEAWDLGFNLGNALKYISRAGYKDSRLVDLKKSLWYLQREINKTNQDEGKKQ